VLLGCSKSDPAPASSEPAKVVPGKAEQTNADEKPAEPSPEPSPEEGTGGDERSSPVAPPPTCTAPADDEMLAKVREYWEHQDPSVSQFEKVLAGLPPDPTMRSAMARVLLPTKDLLAEDEEGNSGWCKGVFEGVFDDEPEQMQPVEPTEILSASGCARRALYLHMVEYLTGCDIEASEPSVRLLMSRELHEPDHVAALALVAQAERVGKGEWVLGFAFDDGPPSLQREAVQRLEALGTDEAKTILEKVATDGRCDVGYLAAEAAKKQWMSDLLPDVENAKTAGEAFFDLCMLASQGEGHTAPADLWKPLIDEKGYQMTVDCSDWKDDDPDTHGHCDALSHRKRNAPSHRFGPTATCVERKGAVWCKSNPLNENSGVARRVDPTDFVFAERSGRWVLDRVIVSPKVTDAWTY
jgi:hypothetical protein